MEKFISCDWGTTAFRLRLIEATTKNILAETKSTQGIAATYALWKEQPGAGRVLFYTNFILQQIVILEQQYGDSLDDISIIISGMASATIGMIELPYIFIPMQIMETGLHTHIIPATPQCRHTIIIISGVRSSNDAMRGEETMMVGCDIEAAAGEQLFIFPGTHSKHVVVQNGIMKDLKTYMTGEIFNLLSSKSILASSVEADDLSPQMNEAFIKGVKETIDSNILNALFHVRTNLLFGVAGRKENYYHLSGLLIGEELKAVNTGNFAIVTIVSTGNMLALYTKALTALDYNGKMNYQDADAALISGQAAIFNQYQKKIRL